MTKESQWNVVKDKTGLAINIQSLFVIILAETPF